MNFNPFRCMCCSRPCVKPLTTTPQQTPPPSSLHCKCSHHLYHQPCPFPIRATGKAIIPTCASLIIRLPSLELSSDSYWIPINAVFQKRHVVPTELYHSYDQNAASFSKTNQVGLPSLHARKTAGDITRCTAVTSDQPVSDTEPVEDLQTEPLSSEADTSYKADFTNGYQTGSGRLRSGKLRSNSSCIPSIHPEELQGLAIGVERSPYDKLVSNLAAMANAKKSMQDLYNSTTEYSKRFSARQGKNSPTPTSDLTNSSEADYAALDPSEGLTLNHLDIMQECSEHDELLAESAIFCGPAVDLRLTEMNDSSLNTPFQESLFKPSNMAITFTKPRKLFSVKSVQNKMRQHTYCDSKGAKSKGRAGATLKRGDSHSLYNAKHRLALNKALNKENSGSEEGVFGTQARPAKSNNEEGVCNHPAHQVSCALRSQERMRLRLKTATGSQRRESTASSNSAAGGRKVQVYLIKTSRPLEDILPRLNSTEVYCQQNGTVDLYGE